MIVDIECIGQLRAARAAGNYRLAADIGRQYMDDVERVRGPYALELAVVLNELGMIGKYAGAFDEAEKAYRRALAIYDEHGETASANVAALLHNLAGLAHARGDAAGAEPLARHGILIRQALPEPNPRALAEDWAALAAILIDIGQFAEADAILRHALTMYERAYGAVHYEIGATLHNIGSLQFRQGKFERAAEILQRALDMKIDVLGEDHADLAVTLHNLACCGLKLGRDAEAVAHLKRAVAILEATVEVNHPTLVSCRAKLDQMPGAGDPGGKSSAPGVQSRTWL